METVDSGTTFLLVCSFNIWTADGGQHSITEKGTSIDIGQSLNVELTHLTNLPDNLCASQLKFSRLLLLL